MNANIPTISPQALSTHHPQGEPVTLIDVRTPAEFDSEHATGARLFPLDRFEPEQVMQSFSDHGLGRSKPIYVLCRSGARATQAAQKLMHGGYSNVYVIEGGTEAWAKAGLPTVRGQPRLSLMQQVQIAIGTLVIVKVVFGFAIHPAFFALIALIGGGLIFAGITQHCGMAKLLARMPWNQHTRGGVPADRQFLQGQFMNVPAAAHATGDQRAA